MLLLGVLFFQNLSTALSATGAAFPDPNSPLGKKEHPRLFFTNNDIPEIRERIRNYYNSDFSQFVSLMDGFFNTNPGDGYLDYFDTRNYAFLCAIDPVSIGVAHQHTQKEYCDKAVERALTISDACDDHEHDFNNWWRTGGCKMSAPIAYDWSYRYISDSQRQQLADKIVKLYENKIGKEGFPPYDVNTPMISNQILPHIHGTIFGSLAIWGDPYVSADKENAMLAHMQEVFLKRIVGISDALYGPDKDGPYPGLFGSGNPEGPDYGLDITTAFVYPIMAASSALGENYFETSPFTKNIPLFYYYKLIPFAVNGRFYYAWHDTGTPDERAPFQTNCSGSLCNAQKARLFRLWAYRLKNTDPNLAGFISWMAGTSDFKISPSGYQYGNDVRVSTSSNDLYALFDMFIGGERDIPPLNPDQAHLPLFKRMGDFTMFKSSHNLYDSTYLEIDSPIWNYGGGHQKYMPTALQMSKYGNLIVKSVTAKGGSICPRATSGDSPAYGSMTGPYTDSEMSVGLLGTKTYSQSDSSQITEDSASDIGDIKSFDSVPNVFDVFGYDYRRMYIAGKIASEASQYMVYLRGAENNEYFVEFNHIISGYPNVKLIHTPVDIESVDGSWTGTGSSGSSSSNGRTYSVTNGYGGTHGRLFITSVLPLSASFRKFGGSGFEWVNADGNPVVGTALDPTCRYLSGFYTLNIKSTEPNFITVYQPGNANIMTSKTPVTPVDAAAMKGVKINDRVVLFSTTPSAPISSTGFTLQTTAPTYFILIGFNPEKAYNVNINGNIHQEVSSKGGVLSFIDANSGNRVISITSSTNQGKVAAPSIDPSGGSFLNSIQVSLATLTPDANVFYTKDGTPPTQISTLCGTSCTITLTGAATIRAKAFRQGLIESDETSAIFIKTALDTTPPTVSVSLSPAFGITDVTLVAVSSTANDASGISNVEIFVDENSKKVCPSSPCVYSSTFTAGIHTYYSTAKDASANQNQGRDPSLGAKSFEVLSSANSCPWDIYGQGGIPDGQVSLADVISELNFLYKQPGDPGYDPKNNFDSNPIITLADAISMLTHIGPCP